MEFEGAPKLEKDITRTRFMDKEIKASGYVLAQMTNS